MKNVVLFISEITKKLKVTEKANEDGLPIKVLKDNKLAIAARSLLDQAIVDYVRVQKSHIVTSKESVN